MWVAVDDDIVTVGINDEGLEDFDMVESVSMPVENTNVTVDEVCGELETDQGPVNLYSPVDGMVIEVNEAVVQNPKLIFDDPFGDGWLFHVNASDPEKI